MRPQPFSILAPATFLIAGLAAAAPRPASLPDQALDILTRRCFQCHGGSKISGLDLRTRAAALAGGAHGAGITPGKPEASPVHTFVTGAGGKQMPPSGPLPRAEQELLKRWIEAGAEWPGVGASSDVWWSLRPLRRPAIPAVKNREWARNPIDAFVLARLEAEGLRPAPPAGRRELIRRVYFDLTGLPPVPEEVEAFV